MKNALIVVASFGFGCVAGYFYAKKKMQKEIDKQITDAKKGIKEYYEEKYSKTEPTNEANDGNENVTEENKAVQTTADTFQVKYDGLQETDRVVHEPVKLVESDQSEKHQSHSPDEDIEPYLIDESEYGTLDRYEYADWDEIELIHHASGEICYNDDIRNELDDYDIRGYLGDLDLNVCKLHSKSDAIYVRSNGLRSDIKVIFSNCDYADWLYQNGFTERWTEVISR